VVDGGIGILVSDRQNGSDRSTRRSLIDPVNLLEWNSDGRCVLLDLSAVLAIAGAAIEVSPSLRSQKP